MRSRLRGEVARTRCDTVRLTRTSPAASDEWQVRQRVRPAMPGATEHNIEAVETVCNGP